MSRSSRSTDIEAAGDTRAMLEKIVAHDMGDAWRVSLFMNIYFAPVVREFENVHEITQPEFTILYCCNLIPGVMAKDICDLTGRPQNSISRGVNRLIERRLIRQESGKTDRRRKLLYLTKEGKLALKPLLRLHVARQKAMFSALDASELEAVRKIFDKLIAAAAD